jgi:aspartate-semialdehyde dehydrogenase
MSSKIPVSVLAATGSVGQRFISLLDNHPWFEVVEITASDKSVGKPYEEVCHWLLSESMPEYVKKMELLPTEAASLKNSKIAFSALPAEIAVEVEPTIAKKGIYVSSNASSYRKDPLVPILVPEVNPDHMMILEDQQKSYGWSGGIFTNPNCTTVGFVVPLATIDRKFGVKKAFAFSMQAVSGAGYPGVASMDILDNVVPYIGGEEEKLEYEPTKIMGCFKDHKIENHPIVISAHTNRVPVIDAHTICLSFSTNEKTDVDGIINALESYEFPDLCKDLPSIPSKGIVYHREPNRPQPRLDRSTYGGMATHVGRVRPDHILDFRMVSVSHNTIRGAAGGSIVNGECLAAWKFGKR